MSTHRNNNTENLLLLESTGIGRQCLSLTCPDSSESQGKLYHKCKMPHRYAKFCKSKSKKNVHNLDENFSESDPENFYVGSINDKKMEISDYESFVTMDVKRNQVKFKIHTGAQCNIITKKVFEKVKPPTTVLK